MKTDRRGWTRKTLDLLASWVWLAAVGVTVLETVGCAGVSTTPTPISDRKSTRLNSSHGYISYAVFCLKKKKTLEQQRSRCSVHCMLQVSPQVHESSAT